MTKLQKADDVHKNEDLNVITAQRYIVWDFKKKSSLPIYETIMSNASWLSVISNTSEVMKKNESRDSRQIKYWLWAFIILSTVVAFDCNFTARCVRAKFGFFSTLQTNIYKQEVKKTNI